MRRLRSSSDAEKHAAADSFFWHRSTSVSQETMSPQWSTLSDPTYASDYSSVTSPSYLTSPLSRAAVQSPWINLHVSPGGARSRFGLHNGEQSLAYRLLSVMVKPGGCIYSVAVGETGVAYIGSEGKSVRVCTFPTGSEIGRLSSGSGAVNAILIKNDSVFTAHADLKIRVWRRSRSRPGSHRRVATLPTFRSTIRNCILPKYFSFIFSAPLSAVPFAAAGSGAASAHHGNVISALACSESFLYSASWDKTVKVWRLSDFTCTETIRAHKKKVNDIAVGSDALLFTASDDSTIRVWRRNLGRAPHALTATLVSSSPVKALALGGGAEGYWLYAGGADGSVVWWEEERLSSSWRFVKGGLLHGHLEAITCLKVARCLVFSGSVDATVRVWRADRRGVHRCLAVISGHEGAVKSLSAVSIFENNGDERGGAQRWSCVLASGGLDGAVSIWRFSFANHS